MEKRRNCSLGAISPLFHNIFNISLTNESNYIFILFKVVVRLIVSLSSANLICRSTDISRSILESPFDFEITRVDCNYLVREADQVALHFFGLWLGLFAHSLSVIVRL